MKKEPRTTTIRKTLALLAIALVATACQSELNQPEETAPATGQKVTLTIRATQGGTDSNNTPQTRTEYTDGLSDDGSIGSIGVKWEDTETIAVLGFKNDAPESFVAFLLPSLPATLSSNGKSITFKGKVTEADKYAALYPADDWGLDEEDNSLSHRSENQIQDCGKDNGMKHLKYSDIMLGTPRTPGTTDDFSFRHLTVMLRFDLQLSADQAESITSIELLCDNEIIYRNVSIGLKELSVSNTDLANSITLDITNHTAAKTLKAYMMLANIDLTQAQTLTIGVSTASDNSYMSSLNTTAGTTLQPGHCYTLRSTLVKVDPTLTVTDLKVGNLHEKLNALTDTQTFGKTKLVLSGAVSDKEFSKQEGSSTPINLFLDNHPQFTEIDLSQVTGLTAINETFAFCSNLTNVTLPNTITTIGEMSFRSCEALTTITLPALVTTIGRECFRACSALTTITLPTSVTTIGENCFDNSGLTTIILPASVTSIGNYAFADCNHLQSILFEGAKKVDNGLTLGFGLISNPVSSTIFIFLPNITDKEVAKFYQSPFNGGKVYYNYNKGNYSTATPAQKVDVNNYTPYTNTPTN